MASNGDFEAVIPWPPPPLAVVMLPAAIALAFYPAVRWTGVARGIAFWPSFVLMMLVPLAIDPAERQWRLWAALAVGWMSSKLLDMHFGVRSNERPGFIEYAVFVFNPFWVVGDTWSVRFSEAASPEIMSSRLVVCVARNLRSSGESPCPNSRKKN